MILDEIISEIDAEIARLQKAREALMGSGRSTKRKRIGRTWSAAARKRQAAAMRARWAAKRKKGL